MLHREDMVKTITRLLDSVDDEKVRFVYRLVLSITKE